MYTFNEFAERKENQKFAAQFDVLCENILNSGLSFDEYWNQHAIPVLLEGAYNSEDELFTEFNWGKSTLNPSNWFGGNKGTNWHGGRTGPDMIGMLGQHQQDQAAAAKAAQEKARAQKLQQYQGTVNQSIQKVKSRFVQSMRDFINTVSNDAKQNNDYTSFKVAKSFHDKVMQAAQPIIDNFAMNAKYGKRDTSDFDRERGAMMQNKQADMKAQLQAKHGAPAPRMASPATADPAAAAKTA